CGDAVTWDGDPRVQRFAAPEGGDVLLFEHGGGHRQHPDFARVAAAFFAAYPRRAAEPDGGIEPAPLALELGDVRRVFDGAEHQAFTDLVRYGPRMVLVFREASAHVGGSEGRVRVLASTDGVDWQTRALLTEDGIDLRDPKVSVMPTGELLVLMGGSRYVDGRLVDRTSKVLRWSPDAPRRFEIEDAVIDPSVATPTDWLWRVTWVGDTGYGVVYQPSGEEWRQQLVRTTDGLRYEHVATWPLTGRPSEATIRALPDGSLVALVRRDGGDRTARIGRAAPPFTDWAFAELPVHLGGPELLVLDDGRMLAAGRLHTDEGPRTAIGEVTLDGGWRELCVLPSGGDTSYPGMLLEGDRLLVSYYSSHEERTSIYVARLRLTR
ncbi:MAG: sialidase family protein, partial [Planctomycetota bacterium]|nr:sialidase family protein [Planctomycetota bacterium]